MAVVLLYWVCCTRGERCLSVGYRGLLLQAMARLPGSPCHSLQRLLLYITWSASAASEQYPSGQQDFSGSDCADFLNKTLVAGSECLDHTDRGLVR